jgi:hypothetical protein
MFCSYQENAPSWSTFSALSALDLLDSLRHAPHRQKWTCAATLSISLEYNSDSLLLWIDR